MRKADILLLDEPLVNLDYKLREQLREEFRGLLTSQSQGTMIYSTTKPAKAMMLGDRIIVMHEGRILQTGTPAEVFEKPANVLVADIVNKPPMTILPGRLNGDRVVFDGVVDLPAPAHLRDPAPGPYRFGIRATDMNAASEGGRDVTTRKPRIATSRKCSGSRSSINQKPSSTI